MRLSPESNRRPAGQGRPTSPGSGTAQDAWVDLLADIITEEVLNAHESQTADQSNEG